mmetsp:Transcript_33284/g.54080  ORF Transcript_33284/g.54080 Transcript_33284/m.54080 type:complete len:227 (-) Transcript_33284:992-1672(-)
MPAGHYAIPPKRSNLGKKRTNSPRVVSPGVTVKRWNFEMNFDTVKREGQKKPASARRASVNKSKSFKTKAPKSARGGRPSSRQSFIQKRASVGSLSFRGTPLQASPVRWPSSRRPLSARSSSSTSHRRMAGSNIPYPTADAPPLSARRVSDARKFIKIEDEPRSARARLTTTAMKKNYEGGMGGGQELGIPPQGFIQQFIFSNGDWGFQVPCSPDGGSSCGAAAKN